MATRGHCWENAHFSRTDTLEVVGITTSITDTVLEQKVCDTCDVFQEIGLI